MSIQSIQDTVAATLARFRERIPDVSSAAPISADLHLLDDDESFGLVARLSEEEESQIDDEGQEVDGEPYIGGLGALVS